MLGNQTSFQACRKALFSEGWTGDLCTGSSVAVVPCAVCRPNLSAFATRDHSQALLALMRTWLPLNIARPLPEMKGNGLDVFHLLDIVVMRNARYSSSS